MKTREKVLESALKRVNKENVLLVEENKRLTEDLNKQRECVAKMEVAYKEYLGVVEDLKKYKDEYHDLVKEIKLLKSEYDKNVENSCNKVLRDIRKVKQCMGIRPYAERNLYGFERFWL